MWALLFFFLTFVAIGALAFAAYQAHLRELIERRAALQRDVIRAAMVHCGRITALDVRPSFKQQVGEIEACLREMHRDGWCTSELTADGKHVYTFDAFDDTHQRLAKLEKHILQLALIHSGRLRVSNVAMTTDLTYVEARRLLDEMVELGICSRSSRHDEYHFEPAESSEAARSWVKEYRSIAPRPPVVQDPEVLVVADDLDLEVDQSTGLLHRRVLE
jgi:hypothetical protein